MSQSLLHHPGLRDAMGIYAEQAHAILRPELIRVATMARQYLGCPASSASVERLYFSKVGIAFSAKRKSANADTLECLMFAAANLP